MTEPARSPRRTGALLLAASLLTSLVVATSPSWASTRPRSVALSIKVVANHLVDGSGAVVRLLGVDRSGTEYECMSSSAIFDGPSSAASAAAIAAWHTDAVRVPLNEDCWLGIDGAYKGASGAAYRSAIERYVAVLVTHGLYVILDLHWAAPGSHRALGQWPMADASHAPAFWRSVAMTFKSNHAVLFDLFNEPYVTSWSCWEHGCTTSYDDRGSTVTYATAGMQQLVDAVRSTGATTPLLLGGLGWASDESGWRHEPVDALHQLVVSFHTYDFSGCSTATCWDTTIAPLAAKVPVVTGEFGESGCTDTYDLRYMPSAGRHGISYLGWTWDSTGAPSHWSCSQGPSLITELDGSPTA